MTNDPSFVLRPPQNSAMAITDRMRYSSATIVVMARQSIRILVEVGPSWFTFCSAGGRSISIRPAVVGGRARWSGWTLQTLGEASPTFRAGAWSFWVTHYIHTTYSLDYFTCGITNGRTTIMRTLFHLVPTSPFDNDVMSDRSLLPDDDNNDNDIIINNAYSFQPLKIPGRYGRFEIIKPFIKLCPTCSRGCRRNNNSTLKRICGPTGKPILCNICQSIQSLAKFIPRKEFWNLTYINTPATRNIDKQSSTKITTTAAAVKLEIVGKEAFKLVRISSSIGGNIITRSMEDDVQCVEMNEGDILSLLWYTNSNVNNKEKDCEDVDYSSSMLEPLIQFQLVRINNDTTTTTTTTTTTRTDASLVDNFAAAAATATAARQNSFTNEDNSSHFRTTVITKDGVVIDKEPQRDIRLECDFNKNEKMYQADQIEQIKNEIDDDPCCHGTSLESSSSAPLSLPSRFITECDSLSFSFDSTKQQQSPSSLQTRHTSLMGVDSSAQKSYDSTTARKRTVINIDDDVDRTPKKSNITTSPNNSNQYESIPMSSLSYDQLVQLQQESIPTSINITDDNTNYNNNKTSPSLRQSVLSLTVALTSHNLNSKATIGNNNVQEGGGVWMPRLLHSTHIKYNNTYLDRQK